MSQQQAREVTLIKSELETLAMAAYLAALDDAYTNGMITAAQKGELQKACMNTSIEFEAQVFLSRKTQAGN